ncbi:MAG: response regulator transcription factor [Phycisphaeraceae bacterium]|nr:response regulator transcription factor [Phycisphaeraceae bacterium]
MMVSRDFGDRGDGRGTTPPGPLALGVGPSERRLNLLLSYAGWRPEAWVDQIPPLLGPMGVVAHRATSGAEASQVIRSMPIHIAVVDLGLPLECSAGGPSGDDGGLRLLELFRRLESAPPTVIVKRMRTHRDEAREIAAALRCGAFAVIDRPSTPADLEIMLDVLRRCLTRFYHGRWPGCPSTDS